MNSINRKVKSSYSIILLVLLMQFFTQESSAQCTIGDSIGEYDATSLQLGVRTKINDTISAGEYITLQNIEAEFTYTLDVCGDGANTNLTLFDASKANIAFSDNGCGNDGQITFIAPASGVYFVQLNLASCGSDLVDHDLYLEKDTSYCPLGVANSTFNTTPLVANTRTLISSTVKAGQYITLNNIVANTTYIIDACSDPANTSLTLRDTLGNSIQFSSNGCGDDGEITFTAPTNGNYNVSLNLDSCGTDAVNHSLYITKSSCNNPDSVDISVTQTASCFGDNAILSFGGALNDADFWVVYKDTVGGEILDTAYTSPYTFAPLQGTNVYYVRGEGGCVYAEGAIWDSLSIKTNYKDASFSYNASSYCLQDVDTIPNISGEAGGSFSSTPAGLSLNTTTGRIDNSASTPGVYDITYTTLSPCAASFTVSVSITSLDDVTYTYGATSFCKSDNDPIPTISGVPGGTFSASSANLVVNASNGIIDLGASVAGTYTLNYTTSGNCGNVGSKTITINNADDGSFSYASNSYCADGTDPTPTVAGLAGGAFTSTSGLVLTASTGQIDVSASTAGFYNVFYTTAGSCPATTNFSVELFSVDDATYDYGKTTFCINESDPIPNTNASGVFSATPAGLAITPSNGLIDISASTVQTYNLTYTTTDVCPATFSQNFTIGNLDDAGFSYPAGNYCLSGTDPSATVTGLAGGTFSSSPIGLAVNSSTGVIDLSASTPTNYSVIYTTNGSCPNTSTFPFAVSNLDNASFNYSKNNYCITSADPTPTITGLSGGVFSSTPAGLTLNSTSGLINIGSSSIDTYSITYTTTGSCPNTNTQSIILSSLDNANFDYSSASYCAFSTDALPAISGLTSGSFSSSPAGLSMQQNNGYINTGSSNPGTYTITYTTAGDCMNSSSDVVTIIAADDATFNYDAVEYCEGAADPSPNVIGFNVGTYSSSPPGLSINATDGEIDLSTSLAEVYSVEYTTGGICPNSSTQVIIVLGASDAGFTYGSSNYCVSSSDPAPSITGLTGGVFSSVPSGLSLDPFTGVIDVSSSTVGSYNVTYTVGGDCPNSQTQVVNIDDLDNADFSYSSFNFCTSGTDPFPTIAGLPGGDFSSSPAGLVLYTASGEIDLSASAIGNYSVNYTTSGACPNSSTQNFFLRDFDDASFAYAQSTYCVIDTDPSPTITGFSGGTFSSTPAGMTINLLSGKIDVSASTPGIYDVAYTTSGDCPNTNIQTITVSALDDPSFNYSSSNYCTTDSDPSATIIGTSGGTFSSSPAGLDLDAISGLITLNNSSPNTYNVVYTTNGACPSSASQTVTVNGLDAPGFNYGTGSFCSSSANPFPTITGDFGGVFSSTPSGLVLDPSTGEIDIATSTLNNYTITYATQGTCPNTSDEIVVLNAFDDASFAYSSNSYCTSNSNPTPVVTGISGGSFSYSPSGLLFDAPTGTINLSNSLLGTYTITYATGGSCANSSSQVIDVVAVDDASFSYTGTHFCTNDADPMAIISGASGGVFTSFPSGLVVDANSGSVDISASALGNYSVTYTTSGSCPTPSTELFDLSSIPTVNQNIQGCDSVTLHGNQYFTSQIVIDTLSGIYCDSIVNTDLTINMANAGLDAVSAWCSHTWIDGNEYFINNNTATYTIVNQGGCDSLVTLNLTVTSVDTSVNLYNSTFVSNASNATYQWVNCTQGYSIIPNATGKTFTPTQNGNYAVIVTENACTDTSACTFLTNVGVASNENNTNIKIYPNPVEELVNIEVENTSVMDVVITNIEGKIVKSEVIKGAIVTQISMANFEPGIYFITVSTEEYQTTIKLVKI